VKGVVMMKSSFLMFLVFHLFSFSAQAFKGGKKLVEQPVGFLRLQIMFDEGYSICSATKVGSNLFLTAAHCFLPLVNGQVENQNFVPKIQSLSLKNKVVRQITRLYMNPDFIEQQMFGGDFALFVLDKDIADLKIAKIDFNHRLTIGQTYRSVGNNKDVNELKLDLRYDDLVLHDLNETSGIFDAKLGKGRVTVGDSGGALYRYNEATNKYDTVVGVACALTHKFKVITDKIYYSRIDSGADLNARDWVEGNIKAEIESRK
jgi:hypothetical protein